MKSMLSTAIKIAVNAHDGQFDKGGNAYILHPLKVMHYLKSDDEELQAIAVLHDVIEDSNVTYADLTENGMTERVVIAIRLLTKVPGQTHEEYLSRICSSKDAMKVKLADLRHNSDICRLKGVMEKDIRRVEKYHKMYLQIKEKLGESITSP
jgi:(p)ppGpp synthase/HD superfamily hydrolase